MTGQLRALGNLSFIQSREDTQAGLEICRRGLEQTQRIGLKGWALFFLGSVAEYAFEGALWDDVLDALATVEADPVEAGEVGGPS